MDNSHKEHRKGPRSQSLNPENPRCGKLYELDPTIDLLQVRKDKKGMKKSSLRESSGLVPVLNKMAR